MLVLATVLVFVVAAALAAALADPRSPLYLLDVPNHRSLHDAPTPRGGGLAILAACLPALAVAGAGGALPAWLWPTAVGALAIAVVSYVDDRRGVAARWRALTHLLAAALVVGLAPPLQSLSVPGGSVPLLPGLGVLLALPALVWATNLYNFMDGMDGFAAGMALIGFATLALLAGGEAPALALVSLLAAAASGGFLVQNFPPARIFMGDVGATTLGFSAAALILLAELRGVFPWYLGVLAFAPFAVDATVTLLRRLAARERVWEAHRSHFYQRLVYRLGWSHRRAVLAEYGLMLAGSAAALAADRAGAGLQWFLVSLIALTYTAAMLMVTVTERHRGRDGHGGGE